MPVRYTSSSRIFRFPQKVVSRYSGNSVTLISLHIPTASSLQKNRSSLIALHVTGLLTIISSLDDLSLVQRLLPRSCHAYCLLVHNLQMLSLTPSASLALRYTLPNCVTSTDLPYPAVLSAPIPAANLVQPRWFLILFCQDQNQLENVPLCIAAPVHPRRSPDVHPNKLRVNIGIACGYRRFLQT